MKTWNGSIAMISPATLDQPGTAKAGKEPSAPSATPDRFVALALFDNTTARSCRGGARVKIRSRRESYGSRAWSVVWRRPNHLLVEKKPAACGR